MKQSAKLLLADIRAVAPKIAARATECEVERRIPLDLVELLRSTGVFRMFVPRSLGGLELDLPDGLEIIAELSRIESSVGWITMVTSGCSLFAPLLPRETYEQVYQNGPDVIFAGSNALAGTAEVTARGFLVNGRWPFVSGCQHAGWIGGLCIMTDNGRPISGPVVGTPLIKGFFMPAHDWRIEDTWHVAGLKGTGSHHVSLTNAIVPTANFFDVVDGVPCLPGPLYKAAFQVLPLFHGPFQVGAAEGALDELIKLAGNGRQQYGASTPMRDTETFQYELGRTAAELRAARALLEVQVADYWHRAVAETLDKTLFAQIVQGTIWLSHACIRVADACFALGGGSAVYETSPLQRRLRDLHASGQHAAVQQRHYVDAGKLLLNPLTNLQPDEKHRGQEFNPDQAPLQQKHPVEHG